MATFASLTPNQQTAMLGFMPLLRGNILHFCTSMNQMVANQSIWTSNISAINTLLTTTEVIPDPTGLNGAQTLTAADLTTYTNAIAAILTTNNTTAFRTFYVRAVGPANSNQTS